MSSSAVPPTAMRDRWLLSEKRLDTAEQDKPRPTTARRQHRLSRIQRTQLLQPDSRTAPTSAALPKLSLRPTTSADPSSSRRLSVHSLHDIPTIDRVGLASKDRYSVRWGQQTPPIADHDNDAIEQPQQQQQSQLPLHKHGAADYSESYDKESFSLPSVRVRPPLPSLSAEQSREAAVLHSVHLPQKPKQFISKRARKLAFSHDFSSTLSSSLSASTTQPAKLVRPRRAATANSVARSSSGSVSSSRSYIPHLSFALYHHVVQPAESMVREEESEAHVQPTPPLLATPVFSPFASPALTPHITPSHSSLGSPSLSPSPSPLPSSALRYYDEDVWSDLLAFHTSPSVSERHERLLYVLGQCGTAVTATVREALHGGLIERYVRERPGYVSRLVWVEQGWQELRRTLTADVQAADAMDVNALMSWLSADMALHIVDGMAELNVASGLAADSVSVASLFHTMFSVVASHVYSHHPHFPATPYHLQQEQLTRSYANLQQQHATELLTAKQKAQQHTIECRRWQAAIHNTRHRYTRAILALGFLRWKHLTIKAKWRRGTTAAHHSRDNDKQQSEEAEDGQDGEWMQRLHRLEQRSERKFQVRSLFIAWRADTLASRLHQLQTAYSSLLSSYPLSQVRIQSLHSHHSSLLSSYAANAEQLQDRQRHLIMLEAQEVAYGMELKQEEAGVEGVKELVGVFDVLCDAMREEVELGVVQLLSSGWQDGKRLSSPGKAGDDEEAKAEENEWKRALDADVVSKLDASESRWKKRSMYSNDDNDLVLSNIAADTAKPDYADRLLHGWLTQQAAHASAAAGEPSSAATGSPNERYVMHARERLLSSLRSLSSTYSSTYARRLLLQLHFARGERMEEVLGATQDGTMTHRPTVSSSTEDETSVVGLDELLKRQEDEERLDDEVVMSVPTDEAVGRSGGGRARVPSSPHVTAMAHSLRRTTSSLHRPMQHSFSSSMPVTAFVDEQPSAAVKEAAEGAAKLEEVSTAGATGGEVKERDADIQERRKKKPLLTIQISSQRSISALPTIPSPSATSQPAMPSSPPLLAKTAASAEPPSTAAPSSAAPGSAAPGSARTRFHRSNLRSRGSRATSMFSATGGSLLPSSASPLPPLLPQGPDASETGARNEPAIQAQLSLTAPLPFVLEAEQPPVEATIEPSSAGTSRGMTAYSCVHQRIVHSGGVIVRATKRAPVAFHPFVLQSLDRLLLQLSASYSVPANSPTLSDLHLAALYWLTRGLPALPFRSRPLLRRIEADNQQLAALQPLTHSKQMQHTVTTLCSHRRMLAYKKQQAVQRHVLFNTHLAAVEQAVTSRLMERIKLQDKEETALGGLRAKEAADSSEYLLISSAIAAHQRLGSVIGSGADMYAEPLSSSSPAVIPHHRQRSSMASFDSSSINMAGRPTSRNEPYTRIRSVITSLLQVHGVRMKPSPPPLSTRTRASTVTSGARSNGRSQSAFTEMHTSLPHHTHSHRHSTDFTAAIPEAADEDDTCLPSAPVLSPRPLTDNGMAGQLSDVQRCERILGHFHSDLRRIYRHAIDSDTATQHKALTAAAANSGTTLTAASPTLPPPKPPSEQYTMTGLQFLRFVRQYRLYSASLTPHAVDLLYATKLQSKQAVYEQVMRQSGSVDTLNYDDWLELLVLIAVHTYRDEADVSVRVWRLLHDVLFPDVAGKLSGDYRVELSTTLCYTVLDKHSLWLQSVYASYATHSFQSSSLYRLHDQHSLNVYSINTLDERCMDETDWQHFINDSSLLDQQLLTDSGLRSVWSNVQTDLTSEDYFGGEQCMVYSEFTEALCVLGHYFERSPYVSVESKLDGLLAWLQSVPAMEERRHKHAVWAPGQQAPALSISQQVPANISALPLT